MPHKDPQKRKEYLKRYLEANRDKKKEYLKTYYVKNRDARKEWDRKYALKKDYDMDLQVLGGSDVDKDALRRSLEDTVTELEAGYYHTGLRRLKETLASLDQTPDPEPQLEPVPDSDSGYPDYDYSAMEESEPEPPEEEEPLPMSDEDEDSWSEESSEYEESE